MNTLKNAFRKLSLFSCLALLLAAGAGCAAADSPEDTEGVGHESSALTMIGTTPPPAGTITATETIDALFCQMDENGGHCSCQSPTAGHCKKLDGECAFHSATVECPGGVCQCSWGASY